MARTDPQATKAYNKRWMAENRERMRELNNAWRATARGRAVVKNGNLKKTCFTLALLTETLAQQKNLCAICRVDLRTLLARHTHADHCHETKQPRGVLCHSCNTGLGAFRDDPDLLLRAAEYIFNPTLKQGARLW